MMKKVTLIAAALFAVYASQAQTTPQQPVAAQTPAQQPVAKDITKTIEFKNDAYDFGKIPFGKQAEYELFVKNISKDSVTLERIQVGCGCTTPKYETGKKIAPGESYKVVLGFNGATEGAFTKFATIYFSDGMQKQVTFKGETFKTPDTSAPTNGGVEKMKTGN